MTAAILIKIYLVWLPDPYAITRYKLQADGWISSLNSINETDGERLTALGGGKTMRLMDRSTLFQIVPQK